ncbi:MAG: NifB/NifX family molybdenum-iron cluster-binding protein [Tepidibacter sp.]|jgi:predicted Fe-Mo cluster-binding NifX family protein|uniref:NifB/NifX family molybdenum-iron cluster-binding protein n=1 Tax=Tepidibacter sp. TaxID=2529387 RepID=UPI0025FF1C40|nr:NifB/NifX family molybdenum-iron cluster-binding protein [Tepidibacter sp.]MCT4508720.1 NifB/NifX family molybdenum-iron cluster-binding protein [Tepidibacter sp.]
MKIAVASDNKIVSGHFGHCEGFRVYEAEGNKVLKSEFVENPGHRPGFLPVFLKELNVNVIIAGGMGATAQDLFRENNIEVVVGASGLTDESVQNYIDGSLKSTNSVCTEHAHEGNCNG